MFIINEKDIQENVTLESNEEGTVEAETVLEENRKGDVKETEILEETKKEPEFSPHDFGWESLASVETSRQQQLIAEVYSVMNQGDDARIEFIKKEWNTLSELDIDESLERRFNEAIENYENRQERIEHAQAKKKELIEESRILMKSTDWNKTAQKLQDLQTQWKAAGFAGVDVDQALWEEFRANNDVFFDARSAHYESLRDKRKDAKSIKEELIAEADKIKSSTEWKETSDAMRDLMTRWKQAGFAGRDHEDRLWEEFNAHRQHFYQQQREFFDSLHDRQDEARAKKEDIVQRTQKLVQSFNQDVSRENIEALFNEWKEAGHSGRDHEPKLWETFKALQDEFYSKLKNRQFNQVEARRQEIEQELDLLDVRQDALDALNEKIELKLVSLEGQAKGNNSEALQEEIKGLKEAYEDNNKKLDEYIQAQAKLQNELNRIF